MARYKSTKMNINGFSGALAPRMGKVGLWKQNELPYDTISQPANKRNISILT